MSVTFTLAQLIVKETKEALLAKALSIATTLGLPVETWDAGDPTRGDFHVLTEILETVEIIVANYIAGQFLDLAAELDSTTWLRAKAYESYGYEARDATYATCTLRLTNSGGGYYPLEAGAVRAKSSVSGATYYSTSGGVLAIGPGTTLDVEIQADVAGSDGSASIGEIDTLVTTLLGVTCSNTTAAVGADAESAASIVQGCRDSLGPLSAMGPADAYDSVSKNSVLTGTPNITKSRTMADSSTGNVVVYLAGASGAVSGADVTAVEAAVAQWALPLGITPTIVSASVSTVDITYEIWVYDSLSESEATITDAIDTALNAMFASRPIGGDIASGSGNGKLWHALIESTIRNVYPQHTFNVEVTVPAGDTDLTIGQVAVKGVVTPHITWEQAP